MSDDPKPRGFDSLREAMAAIIKHEEAKRREDTGVKNTPVKTSSRKEVS